LKRLRSPGNNTNNACNVNYDGQVYSNNNNNNVNNSLGVRVDLKGIWPVMLLKETASVPFFKGTESLSGIGKTHTVGWKRRETFSSLHGFCYS
jgi:hypothetical protein